MEKFDGCALKSTATRLVFADGNPQARIMFVGEAPGREEDIEGLPFVGRSGKLLDRMIAAIGLDRTSAYIANVIPWRPPGNRTPTPQETQICLPFIQRQIELVNPDVLVTLGNPSTQTLLSTREGIMKTRGRWFDYDTGTRVIRALATFHPAYLLRSPSYKRMAWQDLRAIAKALEHAPSHSTCGAVRPLPPRVSASGRPFGKARQILALGQPGHIMRGPDVHGRPDRRIIVERRDPKHDMRLVGAPGDNVGAAHGTETPHSAGRGFEGRKFFLAGDQMKMIPRDARRGCYGAACAFRQVVQ